MRSAVVLLAMTLAFPAFADDMKMPVNGADLKWGPVPPVLPKGAEIAVLSGNPFEKGAYVLRLKMPAGYKLPAQIGRASCRERV